MLVRLIYASTATAGVGMNEFKLILKQSQVNNHQRDLSGVLAFNSKIFLQGLEGSREQVNELYTRLLQDKRHHTVAVLDYEEIEERQWADWSMGFAASSAENRALFMKYSGQSVFNPYGMAGSAVKKMLDVLAGKSIAMSVPAAKLDAAEPKSSGYTPLAAQPVIPQREPFVMRSPPAVLPAVPQAAPVAAPVAASVAAPIAASPVRTLPAASGNATDQGFLGRFLNR